MPKIHVMCHQAAGMYRGGRHNPRHAEYETGVHTPDQLRDLLACPYHTVVVGDLLTEEQVAAFEQHAAEVQARAAETDQAQSKTGKKV